MHIHKLYASIEHSIFCVYVIVMRPLIIMLLLTRIHIEFMFVISHLFCMCVSVCFLNLMIWSWRWWNIYFLIQPLKCQHYNSYMCAKSPITYKQQYMIRILYERAITQTHRRRKKRDSRKGEPYISNQRLFYYFEVEKMLRKSLK